MQIFVNGKPMNVREGITVRDLLIELGIETRGTAVEINREIAPKAGHGERIICEEDRIEIIRMVGGG